MTMTSIEEELIQNAERAAEEALRARDLVVEELAEAHRAYEQAMESVLSATMC